MDTLKQDLELLYELQSYDIKIDDIKSQIEQAPLLVEEKNRALETKKDEANIKKKNFVALNSLRKEKESQLDLREKLIDKYSIELNSVKSNDAYKTLLLEIEKAKADKSVLEDELLELMDKIDGESAIIKALEKELKEFENTINIEINKIEAYTKKLSEEILSIEKTREEHKSKITLSVLSQYERLRTGRNKQAITIIDGESCGVCGLVLRPQLINQAQKGQELVFCDNCSRILLKR